MRAGRGWQILAAKILAAMLISASPLFAQIDPCLHRSVAVNVLDNQGDPVPDLTTENFQASIGHQPITILSVTPRSALRVVIVLDASDTLLGEGSEWEFSIGSAMRLNDALPADASVGLMVFPTRVEGTIPLTQDRRGIATQLDSLKAVRRGSLKGTRRTTLWDAMGQAVSLFGPPKAGDAIYVISDGLDKTSRAEWRNFERAMGSVRIFALVAAPYPNAAPDSGLVEELSRLATDSRGSALIVSTEPSIARDEPAFSPVQPPPYFNRILTGSQIGAAKEAQFRRIASFYAVEVLLPARLEKASDWSVTATLRRDPSGRGPKVMYPRQLGACEIGNHSAKITP